MRGNQKTCSIEKWLLKCLVCILEDDSIDFTKLGSKNKTNQLTKNNHTKMWSVGFLLCVFFYCNLTAHIHSAHLTPSKQRQCFISSILANKNSNKKERNARTHTRTLKLSTADHWFSEKSHDRNQHNSPFYRDFSLFSFSL